MIINKRRDCLIWTIIYASSVLTFVTDVNTNFLAENAVLRWWIYVIQTICNLFALCFISKEFSKITTSLLPIATVVNQIFLTLFQLQGYSWVPYIVLVICVLQIALIVFKYKDVPPQEIMPKEHFKIEVSRRLSKLMGYNFFAVIIALIGVLGMLYTAVPNGYIVMGVVCCVAVILTGVKQVVSKKYYYRSVCSKAAEIAFVAFWVISFSIVPIYNTQTCDWGLGVMMSYAFVMLCAYYIFERPLFIKKISEVNRQIKK